MTRTVITRDPLPNSKKIYVSGEIHTSLQVPMREVTLTDGTKVSLYDTSGPYTDPTATIDVEQGLAPLRKEWIAQRDDTESYSSREVTALDNGQRQFHP